MKINNKETKSKDIKFIIIFILIVTVSFFYLTKSSLARFRKQADTNVNIDIAKWNIYVNNEDISNKKTLTGNITPSFIGNDYTNDSVIAPGSSGYCDIIIDATKVDVDFTYELSSIIPEESSIKDLKINSYAINPPSDDTTTTKIPYDENTKIEGTIARNTSSTKIRIYIKWEDETGTMTNEEDTQIATNQDSKAIINVELKFTQKTN